VRLIAEAGFANLFNFLLLAAGSFISENIFPLL
jgi:hypothetical protein